MRPFICSLLASVGFCITAASAQPPTFVDIGSIDASASSPASTDEVVLPPGLFAYGFGPIAGETLTVKWLRFTLAQPISGDLFLDIDSVIFTSDGPDADLFMALYDDAGNRLATDDSSGSLPAGLAAGLSFGSSAPRTPDNNPLLVGQDGSTLPAGTYWFALAAGNASTVNAGPTDWNTTTSSSYPLGLITPGAYFINLTFSFGNTGPAGSPANDDCANALTIGENQSPGLPTWTGTVAGGSSDAASACYPFAGQSAANPNDVWFIYVPSATGTAEVIADGGSRGRARPVLTRYSGACGSTAIECIGGENFPALQDVKLTFPVTALQPVLLAVGLSSIESGAIQLDINLVSPPAPACLADLAGAGPDNNEPDGVTDGTDFIAFINSFSIGNPEIDPVADLAGAGPDNDQPDGVIDGTDFITFINAFAAGC